MLRKLVPAAVLLLAALSAQAVAIGVSGRLDPVHTEMTVRRDALEGDPAAKKAYNQLKRGVRLLEKPKLAVSLPLETKFAATVAKIIERKLPGETELLVRMTAAVDGYERDLFGARAGLAALVASAAKPSKLERRLNRTDKALVKATEATTLFHRAKHLAKVARLTQGFELSGESATWVVQTLTLSAEGDGVDLDGDGVADNALAASQDTLEALAPGIDIDQFLVDALATGGTLPILEMWGIDSWDNDSVVFGGVLGGVDQDGNPDDNASGEEVFDVTGSVDVDGYPLARGLTSLGAGGKFRADLGGSEFAFGGFALGGDGLAAVAGNATPTANQGIIGFALPLESVYALLEGFGVEVTTLVRFGVGLLADIDLDGDGRNDAISGAFDYDAVPCGIVVH